MAITAKKMGGVAKKAIGEDATRDFGFVKREFLPGVFAAQIGTAPVSDKKIDERQPMGVASDGPFLVKPRDPVRTSGYSLIPPESLGEVARVFQIGADKYEPRGWEKGLPWSDIFDRIGKHLGRWQRGEKYDLEDGQHNLASVAWAALVLMEFEKTHPEKDDIHPPRPAEQSDQVVEVKPFNLDPDQRV